MKKIVFACMFFLVAILIMFCFNAYKVLNINKLLYGNTISVSVVFSVHEDYDRNDFLTQDTEMAEFIEGFQNNYSISISKYIYRNSKRVDVYTTDITKQTEVFHTFGGENEVAMFPFSNLDTNGGVEGLLYFGTTDIGIVNHFIDGFNARFGKSEINSIKNSSGVLGVLIDTLQGSLSLVIIILVCLILFVFATVRYSITKSRHNAILFTNGYTIGKIIRYHLNIEAKIALASFAAVFVIITTYFIFSGNAHYIPLFLLIGGVFHCMISVLFAVVLYVSVKLQQRYYKANELLKGKKPFAFITYMQLVLKYALLALTLISLTNVIEIKIELDKKEVGNSIWENAENLYAVTTKFVTNDVKDIRSLELRAFEVYKDFVLELNGMLIDASNFKPAQTNTYAYEDNVMNGLSIYSMSGESILANENYLAHYHILDTDGNLVNDKIIHDPTTVNILVPVSLQNREPEIYNAALGDFYFKKISIANIYHSEFGEALEATSPDDLRVNIIYVKDGNSYFTYDPSISPETNNLITDPIVYIDTQNFDPSEYYSYLTRCCLFETDAQNPFSLLAPIAQKHNMLSSYNSVVSIYDERAKEINEIRVRLRDMTMTSVALSLVLIFGIYMFASCYCEQHKYSMFVKRTLGYGTIQIVAKSTIINLILTFVVLMLLKCPIPLSVSMLVLDAIFGIVFLSQAFRKNFSEQIRGNL